MKEMTSRQFIIVSLCMMVASKLMTMPSLMYHYSGNDAIWAILINLTIEMLIIWLIAYTIKKNPDTRFFSLLSKKLTPFFAGLICIVFYGIFLLKGIFLYQEVYSFFMQLLYNNLNILIYAIPVLFMTGYFAVKGGKTIGRSFEIFFWFIVIGLGLVILSCIDQMSGTTLMPYFQNGLTPILDGLWKCSFYFSNSIILIFFLGRIKITDHFVPKLTLSCLGLSLIILFVCFQFYDVFGYGCIYSLFAISDFTTYEPFTTDIGRLNWISMIIAVVKLYCATIVITYIMGLGVQKILRTKTLLFPVLISQILIFVVAYVFNFNLEAMFTLNTTILPYVTIGLILLTFLICIIFNIKGREKQYAINSQNI